MFSGFQAVASGSSGDENFSQSVYGQFAKESDTLGLADGRLDASENSADVGLAEEIDGGTFAGDVVLLSSVENLAALDSVKTEAGWKIADAVFEQLQITDKNSGPAERYLFYLKFV